MHIYRHYDTLPDQARQASIAVGNFDGLHKGHQAVINEAGRIAQSSNIPWAVLTFEPHPTGIFKPSSDPFRLTPFRSKARLLEAMGIDVMIVQRFNKEFSERPAENFVRDVLVNGFGARHVVAGYDFVFGHQRKGNCELLLSMGETEGFDFTAVHALKDETGQAYSSTRIRHALKSKNPQSAAQLLGRPFTIEGIVQSGDQRGRSIGFPTANIHFTSVLRPARGVYAVRVQKLDTDHGKHTNWPNLINGVANIGVRPTFRGNDVILETHLFDFSDDLYGQRLSIQLIDYIREEIKFDGIDALKQQIAKDCTRAKTILKQNSL